jgi:ketosteroid isomerase-like protein
MTAEQNKATFLRFVNELNKGNLSIIDEVCAPGFAFYSPSKPDWPRGLEGARKIITTALAVIPDLQSTIDDIFAEGDKVAVRCTFRGTYQGPALPGYPKPGERFAQGAIAIYRFANGKIEEDWGVGEFSVTNSCWGRPVI